MNLAYSIMSVDDSRKSYKDDIRDSIKEVPELINKIVYYDCRVESELREATNRFSDFKWTWVPRAGHAGVWYSTISAWDYIATCEYDGVIVFEDDAQVHRDFDFLMRKYLPQLPENWDFFSIHNPHNQDGDFQIQYNYTLDGSPNGHEVYNGQEGAPYYNINQPDLCRSFQGYGGCAIMYSPAGARKMLNHLAVKGIYSSSDCQIFQMAKATEIEHIYGYSVKPRITKPATVDIDAATQIHNSRQLDPEDIGL